MKKAIILILTLAAIFIITYAGFKMTGNAIKENSKVLIKTSMGDITLELYPSKAPITVNNFLTYVNEKAYDGTIFHRIIEGFMIQGGGYDEKGVEKPTHSPIKLESNNGLKNDKYTIAMARTSAPDSATNQFFINTNDNGFLNYRVRDEGYAVFGKVIKGMDVVDKIEKVKTDANDKPLNNVIIKTIELI